MLKLAAACRSAQRSEEVVISCRSSPSDLIEIYLLFDLSRLERPRLLLPNNEPVGFARLDEHWRRNSARIRNQSPAFAAENPTENYRQQQRVLLLVKDVGSEDEMERAEIFWHVPPID